MLLFCGNKILRHAGTLSATMVSVGDRIDEECYDVIFNDGTNAILPKGIKVSLIEHKHLQIDREREDCSYGTRSKFRLKKVIPEFTKTNKDAYFIGFCICLPIKNGEIQTKKKSIIDINSVPNQYFNMDVKSMPNDYFKIIAAEGYPNLIKLELKRIRNFTKLRDRFIPDEYLFSSIEDRISLIRGCMDACGRFCKSETTFETSSRQLAKDFSFLIKSIGGFCKIRSKQSKREYYILSISFSNDFNPFLTNANIFRPSKNPRVRSIVKIEKAGVLPCLETPLDSAILENLIEVS